MTVKTGSAWAGSFVTLDATGALSASADVAGVLYIDGTANGATVTITGTNPYKWSVTLPSLTAGQRCDMYITGTIDSVSTAGFVASEQADTVRLSDGVAVVSIATDAITADSLKADAVSEIQSGLATSANLQTVDDNVDAVKAKTDNLPDSPAAVGSAMTLTAAYDKAKDDVLTPLAVVDGIVDGLKTTLDNIHDTDLPAVKTETAAIKAKTDNLPATPAVADEYDAALAAIQADLDNPDQYKADVSSLATAAALTTVDNEVGTIDGIVDAIKLKTDLIPASPAEAGEYTAAIAAVQADLDNPDQYKADVSALATTAHVQEVEDKVDIVDGIADAILDDTGTSGVLLSTSALTSIFDDEVIVGTYTFSDLLKIMAAALAGKLSGGGSTTLKFEGVDGASDVIVSTVDANKNRTNVVITV